MKRLNFSEKPILWLLVLFSFIGFLAASYLAIEHYLGNMPSCSLIGGCDVVAQSKFAQIGPIPLAILGVGYFLTLFLLFLGYIDTKKKIFLKLAFVLGSGGFAVSLGLLWLQFFIIGAVCLYCLIADISSIVIFFLLLNKYKIVYPARGR